MSSVVLVRSNPVNPDSRLEKEAETLGTNGYDVTILGWGRQRTLHNVEKKQNYTIRRIPLRAPIGILSVIFWSFWWVCEGYWLLTHKWDVVHVADFDCYIPAMIVAKLKHKKIVYDIFDFYADTVSLPSFAQKIFAFIDIKTMNLADKIIIVDKCRLSQIDHDDDPNVCIIYNTPNDVAIQSNLPGHASTFRIFYGGVLHFDRDVLTMIKVVQRIPDAELVIAGNGNSALIEKIKKACVNSPTTKYIGPIPYGDVLRHSLSSNALFALYDPAIPNNKLASPNKLFESMMCSKPIIVNEGCAMADKVREENCGLVVPYKDEDALREAVIYLKNNHQVCEELGRNGRRAYETKYNWKIMEERLLDVYENLLKCEHER